MEKITLVCVDAGGGHACGLAVGLAKYGKLTVVYENRNKHKLDSEYPAKYGYKQVPWGGSHLVIVSCITWDRMKDHFRKSFDVLLSNYKKVHIVVTDGRFARNPNYYNAEFDKYGVDVITTACKRHFREPYPVKTYYQPFDLSGVNQEKPVQLRIGHSPFTKSKFREKGTIYIQGFVYESAFDLITGVSWRECLKRKAKCHIFIDQVDHYDRDKFQFKSPEYIWPALGKSGIEAMHLGCCTITYGKGYDTDIPAPPVVWCTKESFPTVLRELINNEDKRTKLAIQQKEWALKYATPTAMAQQVLR